MTAGSLTGELSRAFDPGKHPRGYHGRWASEGGGKGLPWSRSGDTVAYHGSMGISRADMPQISGMVGGEYVPTAHMMPKFLDYLKSRGINAQETTIPASKLRPTQTTGSHKAITGIAEGLQSGSYPGKRITVSQDNRVLDGHHNWAGMLMANAAGHQGEQKVLQVGLPARELLAEMRAFAKREGIASRGAGQFANPAHAARTAAELVDALAAEPRPPVAVRAAPSLPEAAGHLGVPPDGQGVSGCPGAAAGLGWAAGELVLRAFNPGERRDPHGKWTKGGGALAAVAEAATGAKPAEAKAVPGPGDFSASAHLIPESAGNDTVAKYFHGGKWSPERAKLHDQIIGQALAGHQPQARPAATFLGGGTASGKSTLMAGQAGADQVHIDPDAIKTQLPDYQAMVKAGDPKAAAFAHEESSYLGKRIQAEAAARKLNMLVDGTGDNAYESMLKKINQAKAAGMQVVGKYVTADTNEAIRRAQARAAETGRMVPEPVIRKIHAGVSDVFGQLIKHGDLDAAELWDTNGPKPVLVGRKPLGEAWAVKDQKAWARFLAKAHE